MNIDELFMNLIAGRLPEKPPDLPPALYKEMLIDAILIHRARMQKEEEDLFNDEGFLNLLNQLVEDERLDADTYLLDGLPEEIELHKRRISNARFLMEACESRILDLLEEHPELNDE